MCDIKKMLVVAENYFGTGNKMSAISIGTKHQSKNTDDLTILIAGRVEFNSYTHRRDAFDVAIKYGIYCKKDPVATDRYIAGSHDPENQDVCYSSDPLYAITDMAYNLITTRNP